MNITTLLIATLCCSGLAFGIAGVTVSKVFPIPRHTLLLDRSYCAPDLWQAVAQDYAELVDSRLIASNQLHTHSYSVANAEFHLDVMGDWYPDDPVIEDFRKFTEYQLQFFGGSFPSDQFRFLIQALPYKHYHGVEHQNSTVITLGPASDLKDRSLYKELLGVSSHELFHCWNVTRIRPKEMVPYDFSREAYHSTGFITEGLTTYYGDWMLYRSGVFLKKNTRMNSINYYSVIF